MLPVPGHNMETQLRLSVPTEGCTLKTLSNLARVFEVLVSLRAISPGGKLNRRWASSYERFLGSLTFAIPSRGTSGKLGEGVRPPRPKVWGRGPLRAIETPLFALTNFDDRSGVDFAAFEAWLDTAFGSDLFPIAAINDGSYEFVLQVASLLAIIGLQDYSLLKDTVQWACSSLSHILRSNSRNPVTVESGEASLRLSPEIIDALRAFDDVSFTEEITPGRVLLKVKLRRERMTTEVVSAARRVSDSSPGQPSAHPPGPPEVKIKPGDAVSHTKFGRGEVVVVEGEGQNARAQVNFGRHGLRWLALAVAKLTKLDEG